MHHPAMQRTRIITFALLLAFAVPLAAQTGAPETMLAARMQAFLGVMQEGTRAQIATFFPRRGDWTWVRTAQSRLGGGERTEVWRFPGPETLRVIGPEGPACMSFDEPKGEYGPFEGYLRMQALMNRSGWRRVRGNRFVPPDVSARSPVFVEWRREDGEWIVSAFGEEDVYFPEGPRLLGVPAPRRGMVGRDTALVPAGAAYAADADWYVANEVITLDGWRYVTYGLPRGFGPGELVRIGTLGRVAVYAAAGDTAKPEMLMVPVRPGEFQRYQGFRPQPCGDG
jgi:hypothetical protein